MLIAFGAFAWEVGFESYCWMGLALDRLTNLRIINMTRSVTARLVASDLVTVARLVKCTNACGSSGQLSSIAVIPAFSI